MQNPLLATILILLFSIGCQTKRSHNAGKLSSSNYYDSVENVNLKALSTSNLSRYNDSAKWRLYTMHCDDSIKQNGKIFSVGSLDLKLLYLKKSNDTLALLYSFMQNDTTPIRQYPDDTYLINGIQFKIEQDKVIGMIEGEGVAWESGPTSRYENPLQPEVVSYIQKHKDDLHPWFREEARKKGVIQF